MKYVSVKSILYDLSTTLNPSEWNESFAVEWAIKASRKIGAIDMLTPKFDLFEVTGHSFKAPLDLKALTQVWVYVPSINGGYTNEALLSKLRQQVVDRLQVPNPDIWLDGIISGRAGAINAQPKSWRVLYKNAGTPMMPCLNERSCLMEYREDVNKITTTPKDCIVLLSYLSYAQENGEYMIPDNENLKEALVNYVLYRLYDIKMKSDPNQYNQSERAMHLNRYNILSGKAKGELNQSDVGTLENLKNLRTRMMPRTNMFESGFQSLNQPELGNRF